jgi:iron complex transport system substrate-binding protein
LTSSRLDHTGRSSAEIDALVSERLHEHAGIYALDEELLAQLKPDLILTQELCEVCAVSYEQVQEAVRSLQGEQTVLSLEPNDIAGIMATIRAVGAATGTEAHAADLVGELEAQLTALRARGAARLRQPRLACLEWLDPPFSAGHWVPEMVAVAGGVDVLAAPRDRSRRLTWGDVAAGEPELLVLMPCGFDVDRTLIEYGKSARLPDWEALPAARARQVYAVDANAYFSRPGPRVVRGTQILCEILDASASGVGGGEGWQRVS